MVSVYHNGHSSLVTKEEGVFGGSVLRGNRIGTNHPSFRSAPSLYETPYYEGGLVAKMGLSPLLCTFVSGMRVALISFPTALFCFARARVCVCVCVCVCVRARARACVSVRTRLCVCVILNYSTTTNN